MAEESKKISFGFAKCIKKPILDKQKLHQEKKVDYIECLDEKAIKVVGKEEKKEEPLIIPLLESNTWQDRIINKIDASKSKTSNDNIQNDKIKKGSKKVSNGDLTSINKAISPSNVQIKAGLSTESKPLSLDEQAAKEIIEDLNAIGKNKDDSCDITLSLGKGQDFKGAEESTLEDYQKVPLSIFGSAMLRGMGWKPGEGIGKNPKLVTPIVPELRPIGMGLGADKIALQKQDGKTQKEEEDLQIRKGNFIKIIAGKRFNAYGQIEGFDDAGRLIVKMALNRNIISVNECIVEVVTKAEYSKNSKVLNAAKYEEHKKEGTSKRRSTSLDLSNNDNSDSDIPDRKRKHKENREHKSKKSSKKSKAERRDLSESDTHSDNKKRNKNRKRSSSSDRTKRAKKSKKHKGRDKERQKNKIGSFESIDRRKFKKHRRSRSSSRR